MITHYGLFWKERDVFWGKAGKNGGEQLLGPEKLPRERRGAPTSEERKAFKDYKYFVGLYCLYGGGTLLYLGEAGLGTAQSIFQRLKAHRKGPMAGGWDRFSWFGRERCSEADMTSVKAALSQLEAISIAIINPGFNKQSGTFGTAIQVFQEPHEQAQGDIETKLERLTALVQNLHDSGAEAK